VTLLREDRKSVKEKVAGISPFEKDLPTPYCERARKKTEKKLVRRREALALYLLRGGGKGCAPSRSTVGGKKNSVLSERAGGGRILPIKGELFLHQGRGKGGGGETSPKGMEQGGRKDLSEIARGKEGGLSIRGGEGRPQAGLRKMLIIISQFGREAMSLDQGEKKGGARGLIYLKGLTSR